jgi:hypothetical protein
MSRPEPIFEAIGDSLEEAISRAHDQIPPTHGKDFAISRVIEWGMERGGFTNQRKYYVRLIEDKHAPWKT